jgi:hypothetical protein
MKKIIFSVALVLGALFSLNAQTATSAQTKIIYNSTSGRYEVYVRMNQAGPVSIGTSVISVILPSSAANTPLVITPVNGGGWANTSNSYDQAGGKDYHGVVTSGQSNMVYGAANTELLLFHFTLPGGGCMPGLRLWTTITDVDQTPDGTEYTSNLYTPANSNYIQTTNYGVASPPCCSSTPTCHQTIVVKN